MSLRDVIQKNNLNDNEIGIITAIYNHIDKKNYSITIREIAKESYVSTASVIRLAKKLGYLGYSDMLISLKNESVNIVEFRLRDVLNTILIDDHSLTLIDEFIADVLSGDYYRFHFVGIGYSSLPTTYLCEKFEELDYMATTKSPLDFNNDRPYILVLVSESGETSDLSFIADRCMHDNSKIFAISSREKSTLCSLVEKSIVIKRKRKNNLGNTYPNYFIGNTLILMESIITILHNEYNERRRSKC